MKEEILAMLKDINPYVDINEQTNLLEEDILDSMGLLLLITELEEKYNVEVPLDDLKLEDFENLNSIIEFVKSLI
ncbi:phosphopantetheine-binding protein [Roseburia sp. 499]|uniref:phosphopantetheine-binding protein n=1 Tax=Roseburia sp. 499 TaxID=1261634 RepID=UPI00095212AE|nr:phosphopantetheine-binding protein [Roseburia sp. 499]WVK70042.1 phosphopantetheine-binding protein [Roseburia sp. 499]